MLGSAYYQFYRTTLLDSRKIDLEEKRVVQDEAYALIHSEAVLAKEDEVVPPILRKEVVHPERGSRYRIPFFTLVSAGLRYRIPFPLFVGVSAVYGVVIGFIAHLLICFLLLHGKHPSSLIDTVANQARVNEFYTRTPKEINQYLDEVPQYRNLLHEGYFLAMLQEKGEDAARSGILLAFILVIGAFQLEKLNNKAAVNREISKK